MTATLTIINAMLGSVGEAPVTSIGSGHPSVLSAKPVLDSANEDLQARSWWFNTEKNFPLSPDPATGEIVLPGQTTKVDVLGNNNYVQRGSRLYDNVNHTYNIGQEIKVDIVLQLDIEDLPLQAQNYLKHKAVFDFYTNDDFDKQKADKLEIKAIKAWSDLNQAQRKASRTNRLNSPTIQTVLSGILTRGSNTNPIYPGGRPQ